MNYKNCWCGEWLSWWELEKKDYSYHLIGQVRANTYYYEEGNVQFNLKSDYNQEFNFDKEDESFAAEVIERIEQFENQVYNLLK